MQNEQKNMEIALHNCSKMAGRKAKSVPIDIGIIIVRTFELGDFKYDEGEHNQMLKHKTLHNNQSAYLMHYKLKSEICTQQTERQY